MFSPQVRQQILDIAVMALCGMFIGLLRTADLCTVKRMRLSAVTGWILEVLFWVASGFVAAEFLYYCAYGAVSFHGLIALACGFFLWKRAFCQQILRFMEAVFSGQDLTNWSIMKSSMVSGETTGERGYGKDETKPHVQKRKRKQRHQY